MYSYPSYFPSYPSTSTERRITQDPKKLSLIDRLHKAGQITLEEAYDLLTEQVTTYTYYSYPTYTNPWICGPSGGTLTITADSGTNIYASTIN